MASKEQYSPEFKSKVASEALAQDKKNLEKLSEKYDVPVSIILTWASKLERNPDEFSAPGTETADTDEKSEDDTVVDVSVDDEKVFRSLSFGVMGDELDIKKLAFWSTLGIVFVIIFVQLLLEMHQLTTQVNKERISAQSEYYDVTEQIKKDRERLSSFGVVDVEEGIYRIPIDSVINNMAVDGE